MEQISLMKPRGADKNDTGLLEYLEDIIGTDKYVESIEEQAKRRATVTLTLTLTLTQTLSRVNQVAGQEARSLPAAPPLVSMYAGSNQGRSRVAQFSTYGDLAENASYQR